MPLISSWRLRGLWLLVVLASLGPFARAPHAEAAPPTGTYLGITSDFGDIEFTVSADRTAITDIRFIPAAATVGTACPVDARIERAPLAGLGATAFVDTGNGNQRNLRVSITLSESGTATGTFSVDGPAGSNCVGRNVNFAAIAADSLSVTPVPGASYFGDTSFDGFVYLDIGRDGTTVSGLGFDFSNEQCDFSLELGAPLGNAVSAAGTFDVVLVDPPPSANRVEVFGGFTATGGRGVVVASSLEDACEPLLGTFELEGDEVGTVTAGAVPAEGFGLFVFGGGSGEQLVTATGCPRQAAAFWATASGNFVAFIPASTVAVVNQAWAQLFPRGVPAGTPLLGRCG